MFDVIEHLTHPVETFNQINDKLKDKGYCIAYTPNLYSVGYELMRDKQNTLLPFEHLCFYSKESIKYLADKTGFEVVNIQTYGLDILDYFMLKEFEHKQDYVEKFDDLITLIQGVIDSQGIANHFRIVFRKK